MHLRHLASLRRTCQKEVRPSITISAVVNRHMSTCLLAHLAQYMWPLPKLLCQDPRAGDGDAISMPRPDRWAWRPVRRTFPSPLCPWSGSQGLPWTHRRPHTVFGDLWEGQCCAGSTATKTRRAAMLGLWRRRHRRRRRVRGPRSLHLNHCKIRSGGGQAALNSRVLCELYQCTRSRDS